MRPFEIFHFDRAVARDKPFRHFVAPAFCDEELSGELLSFCENVDQWQLRVEEDFYSTYDLSLKTADLPEELEILRCAEFTNELTRSMESHFGVPLQNDRVDIALQRMVVGQRIGVHTDFGPVGQGFRLLLQINSGWTADQGGILLFLDSDQTVEPSGATKFYVPHHRLGIGFEISPASFHAVSEISVGERYTLCYSFYRFQEQPHFHDTPKMEEP